MSTNAPSLTTDAPTTKPAAPAPPSDTRRHIHVGPSKGLSLVDLREVLQFRELLFTFAKRDLKVKYKQTALGAIWVVFQPLATATIFTAVAFFLNVEFPGNTVPFLLVFAAVTGFDLFRNTVNRSSMSLVSNSNLVAKIYFPRVLLPAATTLSAMLDWAVSLSVLLLAWIACAFLYAESDRFDVPLPGLHLLMWPVCTMLIIILALGLGMAATAIASHYRDIGHVIPVVIQLTLYASPVMYDLQQVLKPSVSEWVQTLYLANPMAGLVAAYRWSMVGYGTVSWGAFAYSAVFAVACFIGGLYIFRRLERRVADVI